MRGLKSISGLSSEVSAGEPVDDNQALENVDVRGSVPK